MSLADNLACFFEGKSAGQTPLPSFAGKRLPSSAPSPSSSSSSSSFTSSSSSSSSGDGSSLSVAKIIEYLRDNPEKVGEIFDEEPEILEAGLEAEPEALWAQLQAKPTILRDFFLAKPDSLSYLLSSNVKMLGEFCDAHPKFMGLWLMNRQATVQEYLDENPALLWNHLRAHKGFQTGSICSDTRVANIGLCVEISENQEHLINSEFEAAAPSNRGGLHNDDDVVDTKVLEETAQEEDEADIELPEPLEWFTKNTHIVGAKIRALEASDVSSDESETSDDNVDEEESGSESELESPDDSDDEYDDEEAESDGESTTEDQKALEDDKATFSPYTNTQKPKAGMKFVRKNYGGKGGFIQVPTSGDGEDDNTDDMYESTDQDFTDQCLADQEDTVQIDSEAAPARAMIPYPAPADLLEESKSLARGTKWRLFEEDLAIGHMLDIRDEDKIRGEARFRETSRRLIDDNVDRSWCAVKNFWNRIGRARSGFDERKNKKAPLATSQQGKNAHKSTTNTSKTSTQSTSTSSASTASKSSPSPILSSPQTGIKTVPGISKSPVSRKTLTPTARPPIREDIVKTKSSSPSPESTVTVTNEELEKIKADAVAVAKAIADTDMTTKLEELLNQKIAQIAAAVPIAQSASSAPVMSKSNTKTTKSTLTKSASPKAKSLKPKALKAAPPKSSLYDSKSQSRPPTLFELKSRGKKRARDSDDDIDNGDIDDDPTSKKLRQSPPNGDEPRIGRYGLDPIARGDEHNRSGRELTKSEKFYHACRRPSPRKEKFDIDDQVDEPIYHRHQRRDSYRPQSHQNRRHHYRHPEYDDRYNDRYDDRRDSRRDDRRGYNHRH